MTKKLYKKQQIIAHVNAEIAWFIINITPKYPMLQDLLRRHLARQDSLLPILHDIQSSLGYVPEDSVQAIADYLSISRADVHGVITYYHFFKQTPPLQHNLEICRAEACRARNGEKLRAEIEQKLGCHVGEHTNNCSLESAYCLGLCANGPAVQLNGKLYANMDGDKITRLLTKEGVA